MLVEVFSEDKDHGGEKVLIFEVENPTNAEIGCIRVLDESTVRAYLAPYDPDGKDSGLSLHVHHFKTIHGLIAMS